MIDDCVMNGIDLPKLVSSHGLIYAVSFLTSLYTPRDCFAGMVKVVVGGCKARISLDREGVCFFFTFYFYFGELGKKKCSFPSNLISLDFNIWLSCLLEGGLFFNFFLIWVGV